MSLVNKLTIDSLPIIKGDKAIKELERSNTQHPKYIMSYSRKCYCECCDYCVSYEPNDIKIVHKYVNGRYRRAAFI